MKLNYTNSMVDKKVARGDFNYLILNFIPRLTKQKVGIIIIRVKSIFF